MQERYKDYYNGLTLTEMATKHGISYAGMATWHSKRGLRANRKPNGKEQERLQAYGKTNCDREAAELLNIHKNTFAEWRRLRNIPTKGLSKPRGAAKNKRKARGYVSTRPEWELKRMRHFGSVIERAATGADVGQIMECYRDVYS